MLSYNAALYPGIQGAGGPGYEATDDRGAASSYNVASDRGTVSPYNAASDRGIVSPYNAASDRGTVSPYNATSDRGTVSPYNGFSPSPQGGKKGKYKIAASNRGTVSPYNVASDRGTVSPYNGFSPSPQGGKKGKYKIAASNRGTVSPYNAASDRGTVSPYNGFSQHGKKGKYKNAASNRGAMSSYNAALDTAAEVNMSMKVMFEPPMIHKQNLSQIDIDGIETFIIFIGWSRSCHSIVGSMVDAHPNAIIAHEYIIFRRLMQEKTLLNNRYTFFNDLYTNTYKSVTSGWRSSRDNSKGYNLNIKGSWQGHFINPKVIGEKGGGNTVILYMNNRQRVKEMYKQLRAAVKMPIKVLHVVRNPFDMVATQTLFYGAGIRAHTINTTAKPDFKYGNDIMLREQTDIFLNESHALYDMINDLGLSPLQVYCEDLIAHPVETISNICQFLNLECSTQYLQMCAKKAFKSTSTSHDLLEWSPSGLELLNRGIEEFPFFQRYLL